MRPPAAQARLGSAATSALTVLRDVNVLHVNAEVQSDVGTQEALLLR